MAKSDPLPADAFVGTSERDGYRISVLGSFRFTRGATELAPGPPGTQRLLAFLALNDRAVNRSTIAGTLWPDSTEQHAHASLRSALTRLGTVAREAVLVSPLDVCVGSAVSTDIRDARGLAHRLLLKGVQPPDVDIAVASIAALSADLLPGWYDDWVLLHAEDWRQLRLHALEALAYLLIDADRPGDAAAAAQGAITAEPLRESAYGAMIRVHLSEGNQSEALRTYEAYATLLGQELGIPPTAQLSSLVRDIRNP